MFFFLWLVQWDSNKSRQNNQNVGIEYNVAIWYCEYGVVRGHSQTQMMNHSSSVSDLRRQFQIAFGTEPADTFCYTFLVMNTYFIIHLAYTNA